MHGYNNPYMIFNYKCLCGFESLLHYHSNRIAWYSSSVLFNCQGRQLIPATTMGLSE